MRLVKVAQLRATGVWIVALKGVCRTERDGYSRIGLWARLSFKARLLLLTVTVLEGGRSYENVVQLSKTLIDLRLDHIMKLIGLICQRVSAAGKRHETANLLKI